MEQTLNLLIFILGGIQIIDVFVALGLYYVYQKNTDYLLVVAIWSGLCTMFFGDGLLGELSNIHIYLSYTFVGLSAIAMGELVGRHFNFNFPFKKSAQLFFLSILVSLFTWKFITNDFLTLSLIVSFGAVGPVWYSLFRAFKNIKNKECKNLSSIDYVFLFVVFVWALHFMDYPFLRPLNDLKYSIFGFSFALVITYMASILFPVVINRRIYMELNETLEDKLIEKNDLLLKAQDQIIAREKLASLGALAAGIAHEIKNPLNIIKNGALLINQFVQNDMRNYINFTPKNDESFEDVVSKDIKRLEDVAKLVDKNAQRADNIVRNMLVQSRSGKSVLRSIDLNELVIESINFVRESTKAKYPFELEIKPELTPMGNLSLYNDDLARALINIFDNALYALYKENKRNKFKPKLMIRTFLQTDFVIIEIEDNGPGIEEEILKEILNPFFTTKPTGEGTGLGLSMAFDVIKMHDGDIEIDSSTGNDSYTLFTLKISKTLM